MPIRQLRMSKFPVYVFPRSRLSKEYSSRDRAFFSMSTKVAAQNSLYIILISQISSLLTTIVTNSVPEFHFLWLLVMAGGGIIGGIIGRSLNKKMDEKAVNTLFTVFLFVIIGISVYNTIRFL